MAIFLYLNFKSNFSPDDFHHVAFKTTNYEIMVEFYKNLFGCMPVYDIDLITFFPFTDVELPPILISV